MNSRTKVLIINVHSALNAGDRALLECTIQQVRDNFEDPEIMVSTNYPQEEYFKSCDFRSVPSFSALVRPAPNTSPIRQVLNALRGWFLVHRSRRNPLPIEKKQVWEEIIDAYQSADLVVGVAGNQFHSGGLVSWPFLLMAASVELAHFYKKPFYTMPQSIGPLKRAWERKILGNLYKKGRIIFLRDQISLELAEKIGIKAVARFAPDPAFAYPPGSSNKSLARLNQYGYSKEQPSIGVTIISKLGRAFNENDMHNYHAVMAECLGRLIEKYSTHLFFFNQVTGTSALEDDRVGTQKVIDLLNEQGQHRDYIHWVNIALSPAELKACYGWMDLFIATRLHSGIFALGMQTPTLFIGYLTKTLGMLRSLGLEDCVLQMETLTRKDLWQRLESAWLERDATSLRLKKTIPSIIEDSLTPGSMIAKDYQAYEQ